MIPDSDTERRWLDLKAEAMRTKEHIPAELLEMLVRVYERQIAARDEASVPVPAEADLAPEDRRALGAPMIAREDFPVDAVQAEALFMDFARSLAAGGEPLAGAAKSILAAVETGELDLAALRSAFLKSDTTPFEAFAASTPKAPMTLQFLVQACLTPSLEAVGRALASRLDPEKAWTHGHCPICGSLPLISRLKEKEGFRFHTCSFCHADYRVRRVHCAFCGEEDHLKLTFLTAEEEPGYRIDVCATCNYYIKTIDFRNLDRISLPLMDDLESLALDIRAAALGYKRATLSGWGF